MSVLERALLPNGLAVAVEGPDCSEAERRENAARLAEAHSAGRESVRVVIDLSRAPPPPTDPGPQEQDE